jgi:uncharacterized glyoxalase superfamily protein PhnB
MESNPPRFLGITPYLHYDDAAAMISWLARVFGFTERGRWLDSQGVLRNAELFAGNMEIWIDGDPEYWKSKGRRPDDWIGVWVDDVDAMFARVKSNGIAHDPPENKFYGVRVFQVIDPEGYTWGFMQRIAYVARFES